MDFGAHLPLMDFGGHPYTLEHLLEYTATAAQLGFSALSVNDHMVFSVSWLDGLVALAAVMGHSGEMTLATTVALAVVRGPVAVAKSLGGLDRLSGGRMLAAVGPGSSRDDYAAVGLDFEERWPRFDEAIGALRALWNPDVLRERLPIGPAELFAEKLTAFAKAGVQRVYIWPVADEVHQLERFWSEVRPLVTA